MDGACRWAPQRSDIGGWALRRAILAGERRCVCELRGHLIGVMMCVREAGPLAPEGLGATLALNGLAGHWTRGPRGLLSPHSRATDYCLWAAGAVQLYAEYMCSFSTVCDRTLRVFTKVIL